MKRREHSVRIRAALGCVALLIVGGLWVVPASAENPCDGAVIDNGTWDGSAITRNFRDPYSDVTRVNSLDFPDDYTITGASWYAIGEEAGFEWAGVVDVLVYDGDGAGGAPGTELYELLDLSATRTDTGQKLTWDVGGGPTEFTVWQYTVTGLNMDIGAGVRYVSLRLVGTEYGAGYPAYWLATTSHDNQVAYTLNYDGTFTYAWVRSQAYCLQGKPLAGPKGACCFEDGGCAQATELGCALRKGDFKGVGTPCAAGVCPQPGACCVELTQGICTVVQADACDALGGDFQGESTSCEGTGPFPGYSLRFDGSSSYVDCGDSPDLNLTATFTLEAWVYADGFPGGINRIISNGSPGWLGFGFGVLDTGALRFTTYGIQDYDTAGKYLPAETWTHLALVVNEYGDAAFYVNGQYVEYITGYSPAYESIFNFDIGRNPNGPAETWFGVIDEVRVWSVTRSDSEIADNYDKQLTGNESGLVALWHFNEGSGDWTADAADGHTGALHETTWNGVQACGSAPFGACCLADGTCGLLTQLGCTNVAGLYSGDNVDCAGVVCPQPGACCLSAAQGLCRIMVVHTCEAVGGSFQGEGTNCDGVGPFEGYALKYDGVNDNVQVPSSPVLVFAEGQSITLEAWVNLTSTFAHIITKDADSKANYCLRVGSDASINFFYKNASDYDWFECDSFTNIVKLGQWNHLAVSHVFGDPNQIQFYLNGQPVDHQPWTTDPYEGPYQGDGPLWIGGVALDPGGPPERVPNGLVDEVRIWNVIRTPEEIAGSYDVPLNDNEPGLVGYWRLNDGEGTTARDSTSNANDGVVFEAQWVETLPCEQGPPLTRGDLNCDGSVDFNDIDPFVAALISQDDYEAQYPDCNYANGDINRDGSVDFNDIDPFVECLVNGGCP